MRLSRLLEGVEIIQSKADMNEEISIPCSDSRKMKKQGVFVAIKGNSRDGNDYIRYALESGAACVVTDSENAYLKNHNTVLVRDARLALANIWNNYYHRPASEMKIVAITGTNGKTSCTYYLYNILKSANKRTGLISTIECLINDNTISTGGGSDVCDIASAMTTPDPEILYSILDKMRNTGVEFVIMEASSHAIEQYKIAPLKIEIGVFTNLSEEHLDFHGTMEEYFNAKRKLFFDCRYGIVNIDDNYGARLATEKICNFLTCSRKKIAHFWFSEENLSADGCKYNLNTDNFSIPIAGKICGDFTIYNTMLASACALTLGIDKDSVINGIADTKIIHGRLEKVEENIYIDYAHTADAMKNAILAIKKSEPQKRIIALFGCGGDRDTGKRPKMAKIVSQEANTVIVTADNSRNESPISIFRDILLGFDDDANFILIPKREEAIKYALNQMTEKDILILLGKGHEEYEIDKNGKHYFSEREIIKRELGK